MKKILSLLTVVLLAAVAAIGQSPSPGIFNYQGVARNSVGNVLINQSITLRLTIHDGAPAGPVVYQESRGVTTNPFGLFNAQVGSAGATNVTGTVAGVNWGVGSKYIQVEIDPNGGSSFINIGTAQIASVPYSLYSSLANDLVLPFGKTQADAGTLFRITNSGTGISGAIMGITQSNAGNAWGVHGRVDNTSAGGFSTGILGTNLSTTGLGIGVTGSQNGSGWGVYGTTPSGIGVNGASTSGFGVFGSSTSGIGVYGTSSTGNAGLFEVTNVASTADALRATTAGTGASWAIRGISSGTNGAGLFQQTNAANTANNLQSNQAGLGRAGLFNSTNAASAANAVDINVAGTGFGLRIASTNGAPRALQTVGGLQLTGIGEALNRILRSDAAGNATWVDPAAAGVVTGSGTINFVPKWTPVGTNLGNSLLFDDGTSMGLGTTTPTHRFTVSHGGSTGIGINSTSGFSVLDINAASGDAAIRFGNAGVNQWNLRNRPGDNYLEIFELGGGGSRVVIQDGTGNFGIGETANPTYKLDVLHGGSTGIRSRSSGSFSVVDIDAASGDAALRFQSAGVGQWNTRNRPGDDYYEIFELGGGGSRVVIQDATGNVGIGETANPTYKLDVLHGGSTGIRSRSSGSFSVVDIDAASGDAALRFARAGVNQWNTRNRPADDYYEIFELGGGGSRVVIQDGTGNVGIGETANPTYKLDVLHGGSTGIRSRSSASFSVVDIDAQSGDAALRFQKAGVNQWNVRNRPADDYFEIFELGGGGSRVVIQDGTGNLGVGETVNPTYKLDVLHAGATGIRSRSSGTFSLMDIDAANGDAALRFAKAGVNQWNTRNRPADDYYEIFELGGGGSRFVIQDGTGNVGIGATVSPSYKLDVEHGGSTGLRVLSTASFSVVDIDGNTGDAALRFVKAGVNQWNTRNNPATDDYQIFELGGGGERIRIDNTTGKVWVNGDFTALGVKLFTMDHPLDPANKTLAHAAIESNEVMNLYSGNIVTDASGKATVSLPDYFEAINKDFRYQLTVIGSFAQAIISKEVSNNQFEIATSVPNVKVSWEVKGVRNDARMKMNPFTAVQDKPAVQKGKYLDPKSHNQPESKGVSYDGNIESSLNQAAPVNANKVAPPTTGGSLDQQAIIPPAVNKTVDTKGTSLEQAEVNKTTPKVLPVDGSVAPQVTPEKKAEVKPADTKGTSVEEVKKPASQEKKPVVTGPDSTKTE
ncbi:MAG: hypothetical protein HOP10_16430 [Chitinophagaceae bacterium]|nr:hypothetical protein [Chitinophagaceae bacterium]